MVLKLGQNIIQNRQTSQLGLDF